MRHARAGRTPGPAAKAVEWLTPERLDRLRSEESEGLLAKACELRDDPFAVERLREIRPELDRGLPAAALEQVKLRLRAARRFPAAAGMWFTPSLLEQASGEVVARWRAKRFLPWSAAPLPVGDLCCGLGGDTLALAEHVRVLSVDSDPLALALVAANAAGAGCRERVTTIQGEVPRDVPALSAAWIDPCRRPGGRRTRALDSITPPFSAVLELADRIPNLGIKLAPATDHAELDAHLGGRPHEREVLSVDGDCREMVLWLGELATPGVRRATVLPAGASLSGVPEPMPDSGPGAGFLFEPDGAILRAGLVGNLARTLQAWPLDPRLALLASDSVTATAFGTWYQVEPSRPFSLRALAEHLQALGASDVVIKTRGSAVEPEELRRRLRSVLKHGRPGCCPVVFVTRLNGRAVMLMGERIDLES